MATKNVRRSSCPFRRHLWILNRYLRNHQRSMFQLEFNSRKTHLKIPSPALVRSSVAALKRCVWRCIVNVSLRVSSVGVSAHATLVVMMAITRPKSTNLGKIFWRGILWLSKRKWVRISIGKGVLVRSQAARRHTVSASSSVSSATITVNALGARTAKSNQRLSLQEWARKSRSNVSAEADLIMLYIQIS